MKDLNELLQQFNDIQDMPISEELLGAYIEGRTEKNEEELIEKSISDNSILKETVDIVSKESYSENNFDWDLYKGDFGFWELGMPPIVTEDSIKSWIDDTNNINNIEVENMEEQKLSQSLWGEPGQNFKDPFFIQQPDDHSCALRSQQIVLRDFGIDIPFKDLERIALEYGVYSEDGTWTTDIGKVLEIAGVPMHQTWGATIHDLTHELAQGHRIIVSVDAHELWNNDTLVGKFKNWYQDVIGNQGGNHALIVAGVEVNPNNPSDVKVVLTDPGSGDLRIEYPMNQFMDAWQDSNCFMAATNNPAPYQYDPSSGKEVPSNFVIEQHFNEFVTNNSYTLAPDLINVPEDYLAVYQEHLDMVGEMTYEEFDTQYQEIVSSRVPSPSADDDEDEKHDDDKDKAIYDDEEDKHDEDEDINDDDESKFGEDEAEDIIDDDNDDDEE